MSIKHALVVDDSKSARFSLKKLLQQQDIKTEFAESAGDALNYLTSNTPDIIFMDHLMPGMDGFEATKAIKSNPDLKDIPIIMCTSKEGNDYAQQAIAIGAYAILPKPAPAATLAAILNRLDPSSAGKMDSLGATENKPSQSVGVSTRVVENMVRKILEERFEASQKQLLEAIRENLLAEVKQDIAHAKSDLRVELNSRMDNQIREQSTSICQRVAGDLIDNRYDEISKKVESHLNSSLGSISDAMETNRKASPELIEEVKKIAQFTSAATAGEAAKEAATEISQSIAQDVAQEELSNLKSSVSEQLSADLGDRIKSSKMFGVAGFLCGVVALLVVIFS